MHEKSVETYPIRAFGLLNWTVGTFLACLLSGCASHDSKTTHHVGYIEIMEVEGPTVGVTSKFVQTIGFRVGNGIGVGYFEEKRVAVPLDCRILIIVKGQSQLDEALQRLEDLQGRELCVAIEP